MERRKAREVKVGSVVIGGNADIPVQSMTNIPAHDFEGTVSQLLRLQKAGGDIARIAVPEESVAEVFSYAKNNGVTMPLVADIHFDYKIALAALK